MIIYKGLARDMRRHLAQLEKSVANSQEATISDIKPTDKSGR